jgi:hypothetical protein
MAKTLKAYLGKMPIVTRRNRISTFGFIIVTINEDKHMINKAIYLAFGTPLEGEKKLLGLWRLSVKQWL